MEALRAENARLRAINQAQDRLLRREIAQRDADFRCIQVLQQQIGELRRLRDKRSNENEDSENEES